MSVPADLRYGFRRLNNNAGFTAVAVICLALGIGASITVFSVVNSFLIRDFPGVLGQDRIYSVATEPALSGSRPPIPTALALRYQQASHAFTDLAAYHPLPLNLSGVGEPLRIDAHLVSGNYFTVLGLEAATGRVLTAGNAKGGREIVLSHRLSSRLFGVRQALGSQVRLNGHPFTVIGVAPEGFQGTVLNSPADVWISWETAPLFLSWMRTAPDPSRYGWLFFFFGRLAPGVDTQAAQAELDRLASRFAKEDPGLRESSRLVVYESISVWPGTRREVARPLFLLSGLVCLLMLTVCLNVGGLLLGREAARQEEIGVRLALGVTRRQLVRQLLAESVSLSMLGGIAGFLLSLFAMDAIRGWALGLYLPKIEDLAIDFRVVGFTLLVSLGTGGLFGLGPALWATRRQAVPLLHRGGASSGPDRNRTRFQEILVVGQVTLSLMLLVSTGLFVRTLWNLQRVDPGFDSRNVLRFTFDLSMQGYSEEQGAAFLDRLLELVRLSPEIRLSALSASAPLSPISETKLSSYLRLPAEPEEQALSLGYNLVTPGFFQTLQIPLVQGRDFLPEDRQGSAHVVIVDETLAVKLWPGRNPIGQQVVWRKGARARVCEVVGVVRRIYADDLSSAPEPIFYAPLAQSYWPSLSLQVKPAHNLTQARDETVAVFRKLAPGLAVDVRVMEDDVDQAMSQPRLFSVMLGSFSLTALLVTAIGLYGTLSYAVSRRTRELGIRMALGARSSEIMGMVLRRGLALTFLGLTLGILAAVWTTGALSSLLFGVTPTDPAVFAVVVVILILVGLLASSLPAWRATRVDPMTIIRHE